MANVLLGATGSVAAVRVPALAAALAAAGHDVKVVATDAAAYFFDPGDVIAALRGGVGLSANGPDARTWSTPPPGPLPQGGRGCPPNSPSRDTAEPAMVPGQSVGASPPFPLREGGPGGVGGSGLLYRDADEWPGERYERGDSVLHVELRTWADLFLIAPLDANTLAKLAVGLCDNCLTCVWRAWDMARPVVLAPAMNTLMWEHPFTRRHLRSLAADFGAGHIPAHLDGATLLAQINDRSPTLRVVPPITKALACGDVGVGAMAEVPDVVAAVRDAVARRESAA